MQVTRPIGLRAELREYLEALGGRDVQPYVQSGNVILTLSTTLEKTIDSRLGDAIRDRAR